MLSHSVSIKHKKSKGASTVPWGTPDVTTAGWFCLPIYVKQHIELYLKENSLARLTSFKEFNNGTIYVIARYLWQILLNALEKSRI